MNTNSFSPSGRERALVLGGGAAAGNAWLIGVLAGLLDGGVDVTTADLVVGTSAGATAAAQLTSTPLPLLFSHIVDAPPPTRPAAGAGGPSGPRVGGPPDGLLAVIAASTDAADFRRRLGAKTLAAGGDSAPNGWRDTVASRLPGASWPDRDLAITAIDAETGDGVVLTRESGVDLIDAVAASTSNGFGSPPYAINGHRYLDGGYRRNENADLATGYERVLVLSPLGGRTLHPLDWKMQLAAQVDELRASGSRVETILPDEAALAVFGDNMMNLAARPGAARAGFAQGRHLAAELSRLWDE